MHIVDLKRYFVLLALEYQQDNPVANFELFKLVIFQNKNKFVGRNVPDPQRALFRMHRYYFFVEVIKFNEVGVLENEIAKNLLTYI